MKYANENVFVNSVSIAKINSLSDYILILTILLQDHHVNTNFNNDIYNFFIIKAQAVKHLKLFYFY